MKLPTSILPFIPHDSDLSLLDNIVEVRETGITTSVTIHPDSLFADELGVPSAVGIEYMGQAIAAFAGVKARQQNKPVKIGFLVSTRRYQPPLSHFPFGVELQVSANAITDGDEGLQTFSCNIQAANICINANLNVFMPKNVEQFLKAGET